ncbi:hypothetical protein K9U40_15760 [Xanthobacter autotrophicus]|uniref:hypothetical protein n=1 Tax=Xanthobacter TaxID=279 RepID=UPI0024ABA44A|nr:hypothetical protein [Xanthobacter autotrophicus]MDI4665767.1 hypothetical protein [Xanthobacter autotrophicus]
MARAQTAFLSRSDVPDRAALQKAIDALKLKLVLDDGYVPFESSGYLPCTLDGEDAGFTIRFGDVDTGTKSAALAEALGGRDVAVDFKWSGDVREQVSAMGVCAALAGSFGAVVHDPDKDVILDAAKLHARAKAGLEEL